MRVEVATEPDLIASAKIGRFHRKATKPNPPETGGAVLPHVVTGAELLRRRSSETAATT